VFQYTHLTLCDVKDALDRLPKVTDLDDVESESNTGNVLLTGTDNLCLSGGAHKKLTKNDYSDSYKVASNVAVPKEQVAVSDGCVISDKPLSRGELGGQ
jgi:hypothetical protein